MARILGTLLVLIALTLPCRASSTAKLSLSVDAGGQVAAVVTLTNNAPASGVSAMDIYVLALPFSVRTDIARARYPEDVRISLLGKGDGYSLFVLAIPPSRQSTIIQFDDAYKLSETPEGKAKIEVDASFPFLSQTDKALIAAPYSQRLSEISIELPKEFDVTELSFRPLTAQWISKRELIVPMTTPANAAQGDVWIVFPNPATTQLQLAKIILAVLVGLLTLPIHIPAFRERRVSWSLGVFVLTTLILVVIAYFYYALAKRLDFAEAAFGIIPHALYGIISSAILIMAKKWEATITGLVTADGGSLKYADLALWRIVSGNRQMQKRIDALEDDGRYTFRLWMRSRTSPFLVTASARGTTDGITKEFEVVPGQRIELPQIQLQWVVASGAPAQPVHP
jgi:hypothetical protein